MRILLAIALALFSTVALAQDEDTPTFKGYPCTQDCAGHEAGYEWAQKKGINNPADCGGKSNSFTEGCRAWAEEEQEDDEESSAE